MWLLIVKPTWGQFVGILPRIIKFGTSEDSVTYNKMYIVPPTITKLYHWGVGKITIHKERAYHCYSGMCIYSKHIVCAYCICCYCSGTYGESVWAGFSKLSRGVWRKASTWKGGVFKGRGVNQTSACKLEFKLFFLILSSWITIRVTAHVTLEAVSFKTSAVLLRYTISIIESLFVWCICLYKNTS